MYEYQVIKLVKPNDLFRNEEETYRKFFLYFAG